ncbi:hypothetical protein [Candidatus Uabimicrobium amorphum]|uniref:Uncharacterized protein n=1 Tax=Uabimicrobium amorphum TaxID=2596890 RepID=A0A5S9IM13_UABAM|nr:hypothetical protein [Candidatus Uabimicrobium amorphum]BBM83997.1 hypothetical protein UABAM_02352 [Candidatus Uabimicrobium amorphum]
MHTVKSRVSFPCISQETLLQIKNLRQKKSEQAIFCYSYDGDVEFLYYFFLGCFIIFPALFFMGIGAYDTSLIVVLTFCYLFAYWIRHYQHQTESCLFCDHRYLVYFDFRGLTIYNLLDSDGDTTIKKVDFVENRDHEGLIIKFLSNETVKIYAEKDLEQYVKHLQKIQYNDEKPILSPKTLEKRRHPFYIVTIYDVVYYGIIAYFLCGGAVFGNL